MSRLFLGRLFGKIPGVERHLTSIGHVGNVRAVLGTPRTRILHPGPKAQDKGIRETMAYVIFCTRMVRKYGILPSEAVVEAQEQGKSHVEALAPVARS